MSENTDLKIIPTKIVKNNNFETIVTYVNVDLIIVEELSTSNKPDIHESITTENVNDSANAGERVVNTFCGAHIFNWRNWRGFMKN